MLNNLLAGLHDTPKLTNALNDRFFQSLGRDARSLAGVLSTLMTLAGADVIKVGTAPTMCHSSGHVSPARASKEARQKILAVSVSGLLEAHPLFHDLSKHVLDSVELLRGDDRRMVPVMLCVTPSDAANVDRVSENAGHFLLREEVTATLLPGTRRVAWVADALVAESSCNCSGRSQLLEAVEYLADDVGGGFVDLKQTRLVRFRSITQNVSTVPESPFHPISHDRKCTLGGHAPFQLCEDHDKLQHGLSGRGRRVELFSERNHIHIVFGEECPQVDEVFEASRDAVELEADDEIDLSGSDVAFQSLKFRSVLVLGTLAFVDVELKGRNVPVLASRAELNFLFDLVLLGNETITFVHLPLRRHADIARDTERFRFGTLLLVSRTHHITLLRCFALR